MKLIEVRGMLMNIRDIVAQLNALEVTMLILSWYTIFCAPFLINAFSSKFLTTHIRISGILMKY